MKIFLAIFQINKFNLIEINFKKYDGPIRLLVARIPLQLPLYLNSGASSGAGESLLLRHIHSADWKTACVQQEHAALPGISQF